MKIIKGFKIFESDDSKLDLESILQYANDILLPLKDDDFDYNIQNNDTNIVIRISCIEPKKISINEMLIVEHLIDYLINIGLKPVSKNVLDEIDINYYARPNIGRQRVASLSRFIFNLKQGTSAYFIKFDFKL